LLTVMLLIFFAAEVIFDGWSTQYLLRLGAKELDPLAAPFVNKGPWGQALACLLGFGVVASISLFFPWGRYVATFATVAEGANCYRQYKIVRACMK